MNTTKLQYFLNYAVMGSVMPFLAVYMRERGLSKADVGWAMGLASFGIALTPILITLLADTAISGRRLLSVVLSLAGATLVGLRLSDGFWAIVAFYGLHALTFAPVASLQDGTYFTIQRRRERDGLPAVPYHAVRVFGTIGFMVPSLVLWLLLSRGDSVSMALIVGAICCGLGALNAFALPRSDPAQKEPRTAGKLPTLDAARAMLEPHVLVFCIATFLMSCASAAYYSFYSIYLTEQLGVAKELVGMIQIIGVALEIAYVLGFGWLTRVLSLRGVMIMGVAAQAARLLLLGLWPATGVAIAVQVVHGATVLVMQLAAPVYLNRRAGDAYRNSMQGLYAMAVLGLGRVVGNVLAGWLAEASLGRAFVWSGVLCIVSMGLIVWAFRDEPVTRTAPDTDRAMTLQSGTPLAETDA